MAHQYLGRYTDDFREAIDKIPDKDRQLVFNKMRQLLEAENPRQLIGVKKLKEKRFEGTYRLRAGNYRILFQIDDGQVIHLEFEYKGTIHFFKIGNRRDIYD